jgi:hypothetical protein
MAPRSAKPWARPGQSQGVLSAHGSPRVETPALEVAGCLRGRRPAALRSCGYVPPCADRSGKGRSDARALDNSDRWRGLRVASLLTAYASRRRLRS